MADSQSLIGQTLSYYRIIEKLGAAASALTTIYEMANTNGDVSSPWSISPGKPSAFWSRPMHRTNLPE